MGVIQNEILGATDTILRATIASNIAKGNDSRKEQTDAIKEQSKSYENQAQAIREGFTKIYGSDYEKHVNELNNGRKKSQKEWDEKQTLANQFPTIEELAREKADKRLNDIKNSANETKLRVEDQRYKTMMLNHASKVFNKVGDYYLKEGEYNDRK